MVETFVTIVAVVMCIYGTGGLLLSFATQIYESTGTRGALNDFNDAVRGVKTVYPRGRFWLAAIVSWAWLITVWVS